MHDPKNYFKELAQSILIVMLMSFCAVSLAGDNENHIIDKTIEAYGGNKLIQLQSLNLNDKMHHYSQQQSGHSLQGPMITGLSEHQIELTVDLLNKRKILKRATTRLVGSQSSNVPTVTHRVYVDGQGYTIDHALQQYQAAKSINYNNADIGTSLLVDPLLIKQLNQDRSRSEWTDIAYIQGEAHDVLTVNPDTDKEYVVYLNQRNGYLTRLLRKRGSQLHSYDFLQHNQTQGITWAKQLLVSTANKPVYHSSSRQISFNTVKEHQFNIPASYKPRPKTQAVDVSQLTVRQLAKGVYFVGQDWAYSLFIDVGEYYISAGAWGMDSKSPLWKKGLELLRQKTGNDKPVGQHIVTHHHNDHMMGLMDILKQGANLVIHPADVSSVVSFLQKHQPKPLSDDRLVPMAGSSSLANGKIMLIDVPNSHANHNLVIYLPEHKILFTEDMFGSSFQTAFHSPTNWPDLDTYYRLDVLTNKVNQLALEVEQYVSSHHARVLKQAEIDKALTLARPSKEILLKRLFSKNSS